MVNEVHRVTHTFKDVKVDGLALDHESIRLYSDLIICTKYTHDNRTQKRITRPCLSPLPRPLSNMFKNRWLLCTVVSKYFLVSGPLDQFSATESRRL